MNAIDTLVKKLNEIIALEQTTSLEMLGSYIVGELLGDYDDVYAELNETNPTVQRIGDLASDLEISNGTPEDLKNMWSELKKLAESLGVDSPPLKQPEH